MSLDLDKLNRRGAIALERLWQRAQLLTVCSFRFARPTKPPPIRARAAMMTSPLPRI
jgi:hypothetical protein